MDDDDKKSSKRDSQDRQREIQRRLRLARIEREQLRGGGGGSRRPSRGAGANGGNMDARPEEAVSSMGNASRRSRSEAAVAAAVAAVGGAVAEEPSARNVAAAARNRSEDEEEGEGGNPKLKELLQHLREFCRGGDGKSPGAPNVSAINLEKAANILEACAGNVALAGQLYWDDYFATQQHEQQPNNNPPPLDAPSAAAEPAADPAEEERQVRRRLESDFERLLPPPPPEDPPREALRPPRRRRRRRRGSEADAEIGVLAGPVRNNNNNNRHNVDDDAEPVAARPPARQRQAQRPQDNEALFVAAREILGAGEDATEASASVSDDEAGVAGVLRMVRESRRTGRRRRRSASFDDNLDYIRAREALNDAADRSEAMDLGRKTREIIGAAAGGGDGGDDSSDNDSVNNSDDDEDAYLSDNDWLFTAASREPTTSAAAAVSTSQPTENLRAPLRVLWTGLSPSGDDKKKAKKSKETADDGGPPEKKVKKETTIDGGEGENENGGNEDDSPSNSGEAKLPEIPSTWLHASFSPHATGMGLAVKDPSAEDVAEHSWRLHQLSNDPASSNQRRNNALPLPYHCRGITSLLSIVSAVMLTGASVQSQQVTCSSSRVPFLELSEDLRKREFESRLIDALSSLIFVAAQASMERKRKALAKRFARMKRKRKRQMKKKGCSPEDEDTEVVDSQQKNLERKLKLCPVTWWKETGQGVPILPAEQWESSLDSDSSSSQNPKIQLSITYGTNIEDIRAYVLSNMQSFSAPGGLALLLETIVGIHGEGAVERMLHKSREAPAKSEEAKDESKPPCLVHCTCQERQKKRLQDPSLSAADRRKMTNALDATPPGHECVSVELISLLLTGKIHSSLKGWSASPLGFGMLSNKPGEVGRALSRPELPVWCIRGETCYTVLFLDHTVHGDNLDEEATPAPSCAENDKSKAAEKKKKKLSPSKPKAAPCMKIAACSSTSRSRDLAEARAFANTDQPGFIANLAHWNPWYGVRNLSGLRLITARPKWSPPAPSWVLAQYKAAPNAPHSQSLTCERKTVTQQLREKRSSQMNVVSSEDEHEAAASAVDEAAMDRVRLHPDDAQFYPKQYRLWRFDMGEPEGVDVNLSSKPRGDHWVPYHSLSRQEQLIVQAKFCPKLHRILQIRWPASSIDKFTPEGKNEPLPIV